MVLSDLVTLAVHAEPAFAMTELLSTNLLAWPTAGFLPVKVVHPRRQQLWARESASC